MTHECDIAVVGSGFGGSLFAMILQRLGRRVMLIERGRHPRFAIGESASPLAGILIEQLADRYDLPRIRPLSAYGPWRRAYPGVVCGLKRGFTYFRHEPGEPYRAAPDRENQLLVAASPDDAQSDTHWLRADVDHFLVREADALGVVYIDGVELREVEWRDGGARLSGQRGRAPVAVNAGFVVDASGPNGFLSRALGIRNVGFANYPATQALFSHFTGVDRCEPAMVRGDEGHRAAEPALPYAPDEAALHHVFDGGWMWVLRFDNGVTSAGVAVTDDVAAELRLADGAPAWQRLLARYPSIAAQFAASVPIREFTWMPRLAWRAEVAAGDRWAMLPSAAAFVDPLFSTGIPLTLLGIERLARVFEGRPEGRPLQPPMEERRAGGRRVRGEHERRGRPSSRPCDYGELTLAEADHTAQFIAGCYAAFSRFRVFTAYSMVYFAAASYSEAARRAGLPDAPARFLCADNADFADATRRLSPAVAAIDDEERYTHEVAAAVAPLNIAGLCDPAKRNWYDFSPASLFPAG